MTGAFNGGQPDARRFLTLDAKDELQASALCPQEWRLEPSGGGLYHMKLGARTAKIRGVEANFGFNNDRGLGEWNILHDGQLFFVPVPNSSAPARGVARFVFCSPGSTSNLCLQVWAPPGNQYPALPCDCCCQNLKLPGWPCESCPTCSKPEPGPCDECYARCPCPP